MVNDFDAISESKLGKLFSQEAKSLQKKGEKKKCFATIIRALGKESSISAQKIGAVKNRMLGKDRYNLY